MLFAVRCSLFVVGCGFCVGCGVLFVVGCSLRAVLFACCVLCWRYAVRRVMFVG